MVAVTSWHTTQPPPSSASAPRIIRHSSYPPWPAAIARYAFFFSTVLMACASTVGVSPVAVRAPCPPPLRLSFPCGDVIVYVCCRGEVASLRLDEQRWHCGAGNPLPAPHLPRARRSSGAAIAFNCRQHHVNGPHVAFGCRRCQRGVAVAALMACAVTDGHGIAARAALHLPRVLFVHLAPRSRSVAAVADEAVSMARVSTGCICVVVRAAPRPPPPVLAVSLVVP